MNLKQFDGLVGCAAETDGCTEEYIGDLDPMKVSQHLVPLLKNSVAQNKDALNKLVFDMMCDTGKNQVQFLRNKRNNWALVDITLIASMCRRIECGSDDLQGFIRNNPPLTISITS